MAKGCEVLPALLPLVEMRSERLFVATTFQRWRTNEALITCVLHVGKPPRCRSRLSVGFFTHFACDRASGGRAMRFRSHGASALSPGRRGMGVWMKDAWRYGQRDWISRWRFDSFRDSDGDHGLEAAWAC